VSKELDPHAFTHRLLEDSDRDDLWDLHRSTYVRFVNVVFGSWVDHDPTNQWKIGEYLKFHGLQHRELAAEMALREQVKTGACSQEEYAACRYVLRQQQHADADAQQALRAELNATAAQVNASLSFTPSVGNLLQRDTKQTREIVLGMFVGAVFDYLSIVMCASTGSHFFEIRI
jgi:hypothetical protein